MVVKLGAGLSEGSATTTATGERIQITSASIDSASSLSSNAVIIAVGASNIEPESQVSASCVRVIFSSGAIASQSVTTSVGREKWEVIPPTVSYWTKIAA